MLTAVKISNVLWVLCFLFGRSVVQISAPRRIMPQCLSFTYNSLFINRHVIDAIGLYKELVMA